MIDKVKENIVAGNPWYTDSQLVQLLQPHTKRVINDRWGFILKEVNKIIQKSDHNLDLLDIGSGDGLNLELLTKLKKLNITALDYNPLRIERVSKKYPKVKVIIDDIFQHDFKEKYDIILMSQVLEHIKKDFQALVQIRSMLKDEGILILGIPNEGCLMARLRNRIIQPRISKTTDHVNFYTKSGILKLIKKSYFKIKSVYYEGFFFPHTRINQLISSSKAGFYIMKTFGQIFESQVGGFYFVLSLE
ncbi:MAG: hypothetical protein CVU78_01185 [Elusimicrobia bacterium HGW-Elusimicrobia-2]|nr:MAG: hypothetical protein CVU78_01185 [Elusimicrobia bacterium HGW-Elusimicrobia-2]